MSLSERIANSIINVAVKEDVVLSDIAGEGIFHMPELAFVYECGKKIMENSQRIFGSNTVKWIREKDLDNGGPTDLLFELKNGYRVALEFKLRGTGPAYVRDIKKLSELNDKKTLRLFCALIDVSEKDLPEDGRGHAIENMPDTYDVSMVARKIFSTKQNRYVQSVFCVAAVWSIGDIPDITV